MTEETQQQPTQPISEMVRAAHVQKFVSYNITAEGRAILVFEIEGGDKFALTVQVNALKAFRSMVGDVITAAEKREHHSGMAAIHQPREVNVGHSSTLRGVALIQFNPGADDEAVFGLPDAIALNIADALEKNVISRMTDQDRRRHMMGKSRVLQAPKPKIILPGM